MKNIWKVKVHFQEDFEDSTIENMEVYNIEAINDIDARQRAVRCAMKDYGENIQVQYAETKHVLGFNA